MVEGHQVHRTAASHRKLLVGKRFQASSPNGRLSAGAAAVDGLILSAVEAHGKQLFYRWTGAGGDESERVCVHFGMSGRAAATRLPAGTPLSALPPPTATTRLRRWSPDEGLMVDVSAMTVLHGGPEVEAARRSVLGADPLRPDADPEALRARVKQSKPSIGFLLMDQAFFAGVGNIYRAEILAASRVHPDTPAAAVSDAALDRHHHHMLPPATSARTAARHRTSTKSPPPSYSRCTAITLPSRGAHATVRRRGSKGVCRGDQRGCAAGIKGGARGDRT